MKREKKKHTKNKRYLIYFKSPKAFDIEVKAVNKVRAYIKGMEHLEKIGKVTDFYIDSVNVIEDIDLYYVEDDELEKRLRKQYLEGK